MFKKPEGKQYRVLAIAWALAAAAMAITVVRYLPEIQPARILLLAISLFVAGSSWRSWKIYQKNEEHKSNQDSEEKNND